MSCVYVGVPVESWFMDDSDSHSWNHYCTGSCQLIEIRRMRMMSDYQHLITINDHNLFCICNRPFYACVLSLKGGAGLYCAWWCALFPETEMRY